VYQSLSVRAAGAALVLLAVACGRSERGDAPVRASGSSPGSSHPTVACPERPCASSEICLALGGAGHIVSRRCVANPCGTEPLSCTCARGLCPEGVLCQAGAGTITCSARCASPDTPIATPAGEIPIAALHVGDLVYSLQEGKAVSVPIAQTVRVPAPPGHRMLELKLDNGRVLHVSEGHPTAAGRPLVELVPGDALGATRILSSEPHPYHDPYTYDILPDSGSGTYWAAGALLGSTLFAARAESHDSRGSAAGHERERAPSADASARPVAPEATVEVGRE
jgi:hypothetical protein